MYYILINKNTGEVISVRNKKVNHSENLITCEVEFLPEKYDYLEAKNIRKETIVLKEEYTYEDVIFNENTNFEERKIIEVPAEKRSYLTCDLVAKFYSQPTNEQKLKSKELDRSEKITSLIRKKYSLNEELAILRQRDTKPKKFEEYNLYAESCVKAVPKQN